MLDFATAGDLWGSLGLFEEAADLGVAAAQENAAYLLENLASTKCAALQDKVDEMAGTSSSVDAALGSGSDACRTAQECCERYLHRLSAHRWAQLAAIGEPRAMRKVANSLLLPHFLNHSRSLAHKQPQSDTQAALLFALASEQGDTESLMHLGWMLYDGTHGIYD